MLALPAIAGAKGTVDKLRFRPTSVRFLRLKVTATKGLEGKEEPPLLQELTASGRRH